MENDRNLIYAQSLKKMIAVKTVSLSGQKDISSFEELWQVMRELFPKVFEICETEVFDGNLLMKWSGKNTEESAADSETEYSEKTSLPVLFMNHQDVVDPQGKWTHDPFGEISDNKLWGRGTLDDKGGLWAMLQAAEELIGEGYVPSHDIYFESSRDEETDSKGANYISKILKKRGIRFSLVLDEGGDIVDAPLDGVKGKFAMIGVGEKANVDLKFIAKGDGGHASTPGRNTPLVRLGKFMTYVENHDPFVSKMPAAVGEMLRCFSTGMDGNFAKLCSNAEKYAPVISKVVPLVSPVAGAMFKTTIAFTQAKGSNGRNVLPDEAWVIGNMRCAHHEDNRESIAKIRKIAKKFNIETEILDHGEMSPVTDYNGSAFKKVTEAVKYIYPEAVAAPYIMTGASDCRFFGRVSDGCVRFAPFEIDKQQLESIHATDENVNIECLGKAVDFYKYLMKNS